MNSQPIGTLIDKMFELRENKRNLASQIKDIDTEMGELELILLDKMNEQGTTQIRSPLATATVSQQVVGHVENWDALYQHINENDAFYLLERRLANAAYRELLQMGDELPGVKPFTKHSISLRKL